jgi:dTDP-4-dehydrorhamnose reductase
MKSNSGPDTLKTGPVLIFGASGLLGSRVFCSLSRNFETYGTFFKSTSTATTKMLRLDATDTLKVRKLVTDLRPSRIINCLGLTNVEDCERRPEASWKLNAEIPILLSRLSMEISADFVQISTDHFHSELRNPRPESTIMTAINQYGFTKLSADNTILRENPTALILRTNFFGHSSKVDKSILNFAINAFDLDQQINGFEDVIFSPVGISEIARFLSSEHSKEIYGLLNFVSDNPISKYDFLKLVAHVMGSSGSNIDRSSINSSHLTVPRPNYLALSPARLIDDLGYPIPSLQVMLEKEIDFHR